MWRGPRSVRKRLAGPPVASAAQLADRLGVSERAARQLLEDGRVPGAFRASDGWWVPRLDLREVS